MKRYPYKFLIKQRMMIDCFAQDWNAKLVNREWPFYNLIPLFQIAGTTRKKYLTAITIGKLRHALVKLRLGIYVNSM